MRCAAAFGAAYRCGVYQPKYALTSIARIGIMYMLLYMGRNYDGYH